MSEIEWSKLLRLDYWFQGIVGQTSLTPSVEIYSFFYYFYVISFSSLFILGVLLRLWPLFLHPHNPLKSRVSIWGENLIWIGILGSLWFLLRQLEVGFLGARFWLIIFGIWGVILIGFVIRYFRLFFPVEYNYFKHQVLSNSESVTKPKLT